MSKAKVTPQKIGGLRRVLRDAERNLAYVTSDPTLPAWLREVVSQRVESARAALQAAESAR